MSPEVRLHRHTDYFGTDVVEFEVPSPHRQLTIDVRARVATKPANEPPLATWDALRDPGYHEAGGEFLLQTDDAQEHPAMAELLATTRAADSPLGTLTLISGLIPDRFEYRQGATYVDSNVSDLLDGGAGVCQDFVHLGTVPAAPSRHRGALRLRISVCLRDRRRPGVDRGGYPRVVGGVAAQPGGGEPVWVGADPTNRGLAAENHVKIGHGRHYPDVPPIKGVYRGAARATLDASVTMTRLDGVDPASLARS